MLPIAFDAGPLKNARHLESLASLRAEGVLIMGSGMTYHNMSGMGRKTSAPDPATR
jgi:aromatic ring-opening dioxygenase catalytic subunit (LigB family)